MVRLADVDGADQANVTSAGERLGVFIGYGQSNSDCCGEDPGQKTKHEANHFMHYAGESYTYQEPMLGAFCRGSCPYSEIGAQLLDSGKYDQVVFATAGLPGAALKVISGPGLFGDVHDYEVFEYFVATFESMRAKYGKVDGVLFHQGESDAGNAAAYSATFEEMLDNLRESGIEAPALRMYVSVATVCTGDASPDLQAVQRELADIEGVEEGPNTDELGFEFRYDRCHFSHEGFEKIAEKWLEKLL
jgi:hypothetical protein